MVQTHEGKNALFYEDLVKDRIVVLTSCTSTARTPARPRCTPDDVHKLLRPRIGRDIFMYSITLDPERDSVALLKERRGSHGVRPGWLFLRA